MTLTEARGYAAQAWCEEKNTHKEMDSDLAESFARILMRRVEESQSRTDELVAAVEKVAAVDPIGDMNWCVFCDCHSHDNDCPWIVMKSALAAYKDAKGKAPQ